MAEQNSLQIAFSHLSNNEEFALLKQAIMPNAETRKKFRKFVINIVLITDISNPERMQINKSKWREAFDPAPSSSSCEGSEHSTENPPTKKNLLVTSPHTLLVLETKEVVGRRRHTMFTSVMSRRQLQTARLGIRQSLQLNGRMIDAYAQTTEGQRLLRKDAVSDLMMNVADVAHTMQSFNVFLKWNRRLYEELLYAFHAGRNSWDPTVGWYQNQINFFDVYIIPLAERMDQCQVLGSKSSMFLYFAMENKRKWTNDGQRITDAMIEEVGKEMLLTTTAHDDDNSSNDEDEDEDGFIDNSCPAD